MSRAVWIVLLAGILPATLPAQDAPRDPKEPERLFRDRTPLTLELRAPFPELFKDRDTLKAKPVEGVIRFTDERKGPTEIPVVLETRGHFRLRNTTCSFTPLKVRFDKEKAKGTVFANQGNIKLATHCQNGPRFEQNLLVEELTYRIYNQLTPWSHRTRLAKISYVPTPDTTKAVTRYGFFLEDDEEMAKRNAGKLLMQTGGNMSDMDPTLMNTVSVFQYFIGNTDWSVFAIHNIRLVEAGHPEGYYYPIAYDFDFSGLVSAPYAMPDGRLPIKSVRDRLYRGPCKKIEELLPIVERFKGIKDTVYAMIRSQPGLDPKRASEAIDYLEGFYDRVKNPKDFDDALGYACRGR